MIYNLKNTLDKEKFKKRTNFLYEKECVVELSEHKPRRTIQQNSYLHLLLQYLALQFGETLEYVKEEYYKRECNRDLFIFDKYDEQLGRETERRRSSSDLTTEEMSLSIDRLKTWAAQTAGLYLPDAEKPEEVLEAYQEVERGKRWIY